MALPGSLNVNPVSDGQKVHLLLIDARILTPNRDAGSLRMFHLLTILRSIGLEVDLVPSFPNSFPPFDATMDADAEYLTKAGIGLPAFARKETVDNYLARAGNRYDVIVLTGVYVAGRHLAQAKKYAPQACLIFDTIDLHFLREYREARLTKNVPRLRSALRAKQRELSLARQANDTWVVSEKERNVLLSEIPGLRCHVVPSVQDVVPPERSFAKRRDLLYLGAYTFRPNVDAALHFLEAIWPSLKRQLPEIRLWLTGADPTPELSALESDEIKVTGFVSDLRPYFEKCRLFIAPLRFGAGIKGKLLFSMGHGLPVIASPIAAEGLPVEDGKHLVLAHSPEQWVEKTVALYHNPVEWQKLSEASRKLVAAHYSRKIVSDRLERLVAEIIGRKGPECQP